MKECIIAIDVGGTSLKWTLIDLDEIDNYISRVCFQRISINSDGTVGDIIKSFTEVIGRALERARALNFEAVGIGISTAGPFDYNNGISLMEHKFGEIYRLNLKEELIKHSELRKDLPIHFMHDVYAFLIGEVNYGVAKGCNCVLGITLGSGLGSAFMVNNEIVMDGSGVPPNGDIWCLPYKGGMVEDKISRRFILSKYKELGGRMWKGLDVKDISDLAVKEDKISLRVFKEFGTTLGKILKPIALEFKAECIVFGGQISKSFSLFSGFLKKELKSASSIEKIDSAKNIDLAAHYGLAKSFFSTEKIEHQ